MRLRALLLIAPLALAACVATPSRNAPQILLLGEVHDNGTGHAARLAMLQQRIDAGWRPAIAMEQFDIEDQPKLEAALRECTDATCVVARAAPAKGAWHWPFYTPVIELAMRHRLPVLAANLSRADAARIVKDGFAAGLPTTLITRYRLQALPQPLLDAQVAEVRRGHCNQLPESLLAPMARAQIARDVVMADIVLRHAHRGVALLAGNGHVRRDIAVPHWLPAGKPAHHSVGFVEDDRQPFDRTVTIAPVPRKDACAGAR